MQRDFNIIIDHISFEKIEVRADHNLFHVENGNVVVVHYFLAIQSSFLSAKIEIPFQEYKELTLDQIIKKIKALVKETFGMDKEQSDSNGQQT